MSYFEGYGYSDDVAFISGIERADYIDTISCYWHELVLNGKVIGKCRMEYHSGGWSFKAILDEGYALKAGKCLETCDRKCRCGLPCALEPMHDYDEGLEKCRCIKPSVAS